MTIGEKIQELRKTKNLSQESLAEKIGVTRQTISKWELNETSPDLKQAKEISKLFEVSLDELANNEINLSGIKNKTLAKLALKISKIISLIILTLLTIDLVSFVIYAYDQRHPIDYWSTSTLVCEINEKEFQMDFKLENNNVITKCKNCDGIVLLESLEALFDISNFHGSINRIKYYIENNGGTCTEF